MQERYSDPKGFVVLGLPRSGTTFISKVLNELGDVSFPIIKEPHAINNIAAVSQHYNCSSLDIDSVISRMAPNEYVGFKTFPFYHLDVLDIISRYNLFVISVLRKNIWKSVGSLLVAIEDSDWSSKGKQAAYTYNYTALEDYFIVNTVHRYLTNIDFIEKRFNQNLIYFEDFVDRNISNDKINQFFGREIVFRSNYDDSRHPSSYFNNFDPVKRLVLDHLDENKLTYGDVPSWAVDNLYNV